MFMKNYKYDLIPKTEKLVYGKLPREFLKLAIGAAKGHFFRDLETTKFQSFLKWLQSENPDSTAWWHWIHKNQKLFPKRDEYIISLWKSIDRPIRIDRDNSELKQKVDKLLTHWSYYQNHFFHWFLGRYHIPYARNVFTDHKVITNFHLWFWLFPLAIILNYYLVFYHSAGSYIGSIGALFILSLVSVLAAKCWGNIGTLYFIHSMVPRLGATIAIGYFFLLSVPDFVEKIYDNSLDPLFQILGSVILILFVLGFIFLNIQKRVKPLLNCRELAVRTLDIFAIAATYAMIGLLVFERVFFITFDPDISKPCFSQLFFFASISLAIGVIFQLIWEEKPVTEPL